MNINEIRINSKLLINGEPYIVTDFQHSKQARKGAVMRTTLKNLITGKVLNKTYQGADKVDEADIKTTRAQYLYLDGSNYVFMDNQSYEQFELNKEALSDDINLLLIEGTDVDVLLFNDLPISITLPPTVVLEVTEAEMGAKGNTASGSANKNVTLVTGLTVQAPQFVQAGDKVRVNTETKQYIERVL